MTANPSPERRRCRRRRYSAEHRIVSARIRPGHDVGIVDVSAGGALVGAPYLKRPGASVELQLRNEQQRDESIRGRIDRCIVARVRRDSVAYRGAIVFDRHFLWFWDKRTDG